MMSFLPDFVPEPREDQYMQTAPYWARHVPANNMRDAPKFVYTVRNTEYKWFATDTKYTYFWSDQETDAMLFESPGAAFVALSDIAGVSGPVVLETRTFDVRIEDKVII